MPETSRDNMIAMVNRINLEAEIFRRCKTLDPMFLEYALQTKLAYRIPVDEWGTLRPTRDMIDTVREFMRNHGQTTSERRLLAHLDSCLDLVHRLDSNSNVTSVNMSVDLSHLRP